MIRSRLPSVLWASTIVAFAIYLHFSAPRGMLGRLIGSETAHVIAHVFLYAVLAALVSACCHGRVWVVLTAVAIAGFVQEAAQTALFGLPMGWHELFDLGIDVTAAAAFLGLRWLLGRAFARRTRSEPQGNASLGND
jgi:hypothetical protein